MPRHFWNGLTLLLLVVLSFFLARLILTPDAGARLFVRAQRLENSGQTQSALQHYQLLSGNHPESFYAPRALLREGDLLASLAQQKGDKAMFRLAISAYAKLATNYRADPLATEALLDAGRVSSENLNDTKAATGFYRTLLERSGPNSENGGLAEVKLGRLAISQGNAKRAQLLLQGVLNRWKNNAALASEAQFHLGVAYETLFKNTGWATRAYDAVVAQYPTSIWAAQARQRLGLLIFSDQRGRRPTRRVMLQIAPLPDLDGTSDDGSLWSALKLVLGARGIPTDDAILRGLSLEPFYAGLNLENPSQIVNPQFDGWENVASAAGLRFTVKSGAKAAAALKDLQDDLDAARLPLVFWNDGQASRWSLAVGYDSERDEVFLQNRGARFDTLNAKTFAKGWNVTSPFGQPNTLISLVPTEKSRANPSLTPTPFPTSAPGVTPPPVLGGQPAFVWEIARLKNPDFVFGNALKSAAQLLQRRGSQSRLLNGAALEILAQTLEDAARRPQFRVASPTSAPDLRDGILPENTVAPTPGDLVPDPTPADESPYQPTPTPAPTLVEIEPQLQAQRLESARKIWGFWGEPAVNWIAKRRQAASFCRIAFSKTKAKRFETAAQSLEGCADALERARELANGLDAGQLAQNRAVLEAMAREIRAARNFERAVAQALN